MDELMQNDDRAAFYEKLRHLQGDFIEISATAPNSRPAQIEVIVTVASR